MSGDNNLSVICPFCESNMEPVLGEIEDGENIHAYKCDKVLPNVQDGVSIFLTKEFITDYKRQSSNKLSNLEKGMMLHLILTSNYAVVFSEAVSELKTINGKTYQYVTREQLKKMYPKTVSKKNDMILRNLTHLYPTFGETLSLGKNENEFERKVNRLLFFPTDKSDRTAIWNIFKMLVRMGYIAVFEGNTCTDGSVYYLTEKAWERMDSLNLSNNSRTIFIAMSFNDENPLLCTAEGIIKAAIEECGYTPMIIKDKEHNDYIPAEIEYEIHCSAGMIADFTENKGGVYFEAGIARGLNRPVILTCNDEDKNEIHFDTKQINTIFWEVNTDEGKEEFAKKLKRRIRSTIDQNRNAM